MTITAGVIEADLGSIGGHPAPSPAPTGSVGTYVRREGRSLLVDVAASHTEFVERLAALERRFVVRPE